MKGKLDLAAIGDFVAGRGSVEYGTAVIWIRKTFDCRERSAKDALSILVKGGWVATNPDPTDSKTTHSPDHRRRARRPIAPHREECDPRQ